MFVYSVLGAENFIKSVYASYDPDNRNIWCKNNFLRHLTDMLFVLSYFLRMYCNIVQHGL